MTKEDVVRVLDVVRQLETKQTVLTGSAALYNYGLIPDPPKDLDVILVDPTEEAVKQLKLLESMCPATGRLIYPDCIVNHNGYTRSFGIKISGVDVDFFITSRIQSVDVVYLGVYLAKINDIYQVKGYYSRKKDSQGLFSAITNLMNSYNCGNSIREKENSIRNGKMVSQTGQEVQKEMVNTNNILNRLGVVSSIDEAPREKKMA